MGAVLMIHKEQPSFEMGGITDPWKPMPDDMIRGLELAAYICRMYGEGDRWAEIILSHGEQIRGRWWMEYERRNEVSA